MQPLPTRLDGPVLLQPAIHGDERGFFLETFRASKLAELGIHDEWVQDNHSRSRRGILRGMHHQPGMAKLVRCARGTILDVLVDARPESPGFGSWEGFELSDRNGRVLYAPDGFGHGFCVLSDEADVVYKCSAYYDPEAEMGFAFDDPEVGIEWPDGLDPVVSQRDRAAPPLAQLRR
ncbi:MAG TPA: dTDP-4-dehydrorhamnose 3,5-epimerase [Solirubrobacteraceae bacterium]|nr:dTDP-4-dehydrorhamnose 3,5-epimerase [Solirubrobacteraceae bacterium]